MKALSFGATLGVTVSANQFVPSSSKITEVDGKPVGDGDTLTIKTNGTPEICRANGPVSATLNLQYKDTQKAADTFEGRLYYNPATKDFLLRTGEDEKRHKATMRTLIMNRFRKG